jgi:hypothetical protein
MEENKSQTSRNSEGSTESPVPNEAGALQRIINELSPMPEDAKRRIIDTVCTFFGIPTTRFDSGSSPDSGIRRPAVQRAAPFQFSDEDAPPPKQFLHDKAPATDVERVACLAYYLAHHRGTAHFQTKDITALNTEAAQRRFSNTAVAVDNATRSGYLVPSVKGHKQISASGERFVEALPNRQMAKDAMDRTRPKRSSGTATGSKSTTSKE